MSTRALQVLARPILHVRTCTCRVILPSRVIPSQSSITVSLLRTRLYAKKAKGGGSSGGGKKGSSKSAALDDDEPVAVKGGGGGKKGKGKGGFVEDMIEPNVADSEGQFDLTKLETTMDDAVEKLRVGLKSVVGRVGRVTPGQSSAFWGAAVAR